MFKAAIERGESDARISYPEREQARSAASMFNAQCLKNHPINATPNPNSFSDLYCPFPILRQV